MGDIYLRKYGVQTTVDFSLYKTDGTALKTDAASASGDINIQRDEAASEQLDADAFVDEGQSYSLVLSAAEMAASRIIVHVVDQTSPQTWLDKTFIVETYGNASAQHAFDLDTATQDVNVASIDNIDFGATMKTSLETAVDNGLDNTIGGAPTAGSVAERVKTMDDAYTATRGDYLDELAAANLPTDVANVKTDTAAILTDTGTTLQDDITLIKKYLGNKWAIVGNQLIFYDDDKATPIRTFTLDSATSPTTRTPV